MNWFSLTLRRRLRRLGQGALLLAVVSALALAGPAPARAVHAQDAGPTYIVEQGDTLYNIALSFGVTIDQLQAANPNVNADALTVGLPLIIPGYSGVTGTLATHSLEPGETLDSLALRLGLRRATLVRLNGIVNPELLFINESAVTVDAVDAAPAVPTSTTYLLAPGEGLLAYAAAHNQSPWALAASNRLTESVGLPAGLSCTVQGVRSISPATNKLSAR